MKPEYSFVADKHIDAEAVEREIGAHVAQAAKYRPRTKYQGPNAADEDRSHVLQLAFEREATTLTSDGAMFERARDFRRCGSDGHRLGGVILLPVGKRDQIAALRAFKNGDLRVDVVEPGDFDRIWQNNYGIDLRKSPAPAAVELCDCPFEEDVERHRRRYKRK